MVKIYFISLLILSNIYIFRNNISLSDIIHVLMFHEITAFIFQKRQNTV